MRSTVIVLVLALALPPAWAMQLEEREPQPLFVAANGFALAAVGHDGHLDVIGRSRDGEALRFHVRADGEMVESRFGGVAIRTWFGSDGQPVWDELETPEGAIGRPSLAEQLRAEGATVQPSEWDLALYEGLGAALGSEASPAFWDELRAAGEQWTEELRTDTSCLGICTACISGIVTALASYWWIAVACSGGGPIAVVCVLTLLTATSGKIVMGIQCSLCISCLSQPENTTGQEDDADRGALRVPLLG